MSCVDIATSSSRHHAITEASLALSPTDPPDTNLSHGTPIAPTPTITSIQPSTTHNNKSLLETTPPHSLPAPNASVNKPYILPFPTRNISHRLRNYIQASEYHDRYVYVSRCLQSPHTGRDIRTRIVPSPALAS
ncbi:hypothetical protein IAQ61_002396 [Plenodomus lingam]|uniref:uncharacterized protein n=1 Tax=Leptosphaeria maculans TaxID=5022 RepID=UPI0033196780|nr:hypothetical protein IAQ61_002396 [Plenodomus lingam]